MADPATAWPLPAFSFTVKWGSDDLSVQEVSGLESSTEEIAYRAGDSKAMSVIKMPGLRKFGNVTFKKGVFKSDNKLFTLLTGKDNKVDRQTVVISLLDETGKPTMVWTLQNAWAVKVSSPTLKADGNDVAVETIELAHEGWKIENA
jgi:phage tail-like protein